MKKRSLRSEFLRYTLLVLVLFSVTLIVTLSFVFSRRMNNQLKHHVLTLTTTVANSLEDEFWHFRVFEIRSVFAEMKKDEQIQMCLALDSAGIILTDGTKANSQAGDTFVHPFFSKLRETSQNRVKNIDNALYSGAVVRGVNNEVIGYVIIQYSRVSERELAINTFWWISIVSMFVMVLAVINTLKFAKKIAKPIETLTTAIQKAQIDKCFDLSTENANYEVKLLTDSFQAMMETITETTVGIEKYKEKQADLEKSMAISQERAAEIAHQNRQLAQLLEENRASKEEIFKKNNALKEALNLAECQTELAKESNRSKGDFLANMSHEIRTPMNGIIGICDLLNRTELTDNQKEYVNLLSSSGKNLLGIINDILDFSKIEAGKLQIEVIDFDFLSLINETSIAVEHKIVDKNVEFEIITSPDIPHILRGSALRIKQVLINLLGNAIKFTEKGTITLHTSVITEKMNSVTVEFTISDTGIGISKENLEKLFAKFTQADTSITRKYGGTGLGLTISKQLVELMGGDISVESEEGVGTTFCFHLTLEKSLTSESELQAETVLDEDLWDKEDIKILLVEDNRVNRFIATKMLDVLHLKGDYATDGLEAVEALSQQEYDIVFMDMQMPIMDGITATKTIRDHSSTVLNHDVYIIAMTANAMKGDDERCLTSGMNDYISKPVSIKDISDSVKRWKEQSA